MIFSEDLSTQLQKVGQMQVQDAQRFDDFGYVISENKFRALCIPVRITQEIQDIVTAR